MKQKLSDLISIEKDKIEQEWVIIAYSIMNSEILKFAYDKYKAKELKTKHFSQYFQIIFKWLIMYWANYNKAPKRTIQQIFEDNKKSLGSDKAEIISSYLERLADEYINYQEDIIINPEYIKKDLIPKFVKKQEAELIIENLQKNIDREDYESIDKTIKSYTEISDETQEDENLGTSTPISIKAVKDYYTKDEEQQISMFRLPGSIGDFLGPIYRGKLYAFTGIEKSGKTLSMKEVGYHGVQFHKLKCLDINLEMSKEEKNERFWQRSFKMAVDEDNAGKRITPIFDCENNQYGSCQVRNKKLNHKDLLKTPDDIIAFTDRPNWKVCDKCRYEKVRKNAHINKRFIPAIWYKYVKIKMMTESRLTKAIKSAQPYGISNYKIKCFPKFTVTIDEIIDYINNYIRKKNFKPDILILDYPDVMAPVEGKLMDRTNIDYNWKRAAGLSQQLNCAVFVADQATKAERGKRSLSNMCTSESKTKDAHLDLRITLNTTDIEYDLGLQRIGMLFRRKGKCINSEIMLTQRRETGNMILDSEWWFNNNTHYPTIKERKE